VRYLATQARQPVVHYEHTEIGYNYRLSNLLAALGRAQLARLDEMVERRRSTALPTAAVRRSAGGDRLRGALGRGRRRHPRQLLAVLGPRGPTAGRFQAEDLRLALAEADIEARPLWKPMHLQPVFAGARAVVNGTSERLFATGLSLPSGSVLSEHRMARVEGVVSSFLEVRRAG
jgi:dTDP-4-amino-4,6-dideoxygalactose transaminase